MALGILGKARAALSKPSTAANEPIHFLHIGKCAGSRIGDCIVSLNDRQNETVIRKHPHHVKLADIPAHADYFFSIRSPVSRFRSAFYSRKRKGRPRYNSEWNAGEKVAFETFEHANDLAEALFSKGKEGQEAFAAIRSISHTARNQVDWFGVQGDFLFRRPPLWIVRQEHFDEDMARLSDTIGFDLDPGGRNQAGSSRRGHANDYSGVPDLSAKAVENLQKWYAQDIEFYAICERWIEAQNCAA